MNFQFSSEYEQFRTEVRSFFENEYPDDIKQKIAKAACLTKAEHQRSEQTMAARGWSAPNWPKACGGPDWDAARRYIFDEELDRETLSPREITSGHCVRPLQPHPSPS